MIRSVLWTMLRGAWLEGVAEARGEYPYGTASAWHAAALREHPDAVTNKRGGMA